MARMKRYDSMAWATVGGLYGAYMRAADEGEYLNRSEVLRALALNTEYFAAINLGYSEEEYEAELTRLENLNG